MNKLLESLELKTKNEKVVHKNNIIIITILLILILTLWVGTISLAQPIIGVSTAVLEPWRETKKDAKAYALIGYQLIKDKPYDVVITLNTKGYKVRRCNYLQLTYNRKIKNLKIGAYGAILVNNVSLPDRSKPFQTGIEISYTKELKNGYYIAVAADYMLQKMFINTIDEWKPALHERVPTTLENNNRIITLKLIITLPNPF
jgi:hypothetical protein